jgi:hypothetical protein
MQTVNRKHFLTASASGALGVLLLSRARMPEASAAVAPGASVSGRTLSGRQSSLIVGTAISATAGSVLLETDIVPANFDLSNYTVVSPVQLAIPASAAPMRPLAVPGSLLAVTAPIAGGAGTAYAIYPDTFLFTCRLSVSAAGSIQSEVLDGGILDVKSVRAAASPNLWFSDALASRIIAAGGNIRALSGLVLSLFFDVTGDVNLPALVAVREAF